MENMKIETTYISDTSVFDRSLSESVTPDKDSLPNGVLRRITGPIAEWGKLNRNKRMYSERLWDKVLGSSYLQEQLKFHTLYGEANHPTDRYEVDFERVSHSIIEMWKVPASNQIYATMYILDTPLGRIINTLYEAGGIIGYSTRAGGVLNKKKDYIDVDENTYNFITVDAVPYPSVEAARPGVNEGTVSYDKVSLSENVHSQLKSIIAESSSKDKEVIKNLIYNLQSYDFSEEIALLESNSFDINSSNGQDDETSVKETTMFLLKESSNQIDDLKAENSSLKTTIETLTSERDSLKKNLESSLRKVTNLMNESKSFESRVTDVQNGCSNTISSLQERIEELTSDIYEKDAEIERYSEIEKAFKLLKEESRLLQTQIADGASIRNSEMERELLELSSELSRSITEINSLNESIVELESSISNLESLKSGLEDEVKSLNVQLRDVEVTYESKISSMQSSIDESAQVDEDTKSRLSEVIAENAELKKSEKEYREDVMQWKSKVNSLQKELVSVICSSYDLTVESVMQELHVDFSKSDVYAVCERLHNSKRGSGISYVNVVGSSVKSSNSVNESRENMANKSVIGRGFVADRRGLSLLSK